MENTNKEKEELKDYILKEGDDLRNSLIDKLFNLNAFLSAAFLVLYQFESNSFEIKILNILPFCVALLILVYQVYKLKMLGHAYHKLDSWTKDDMNRIEKNNETSFYIILLSAILTIIELVYLFNILLN